MNSAPAHAATAPRSPPDALFDELMASVLRGERAPWPDAWAGQPVRSRFAERAIYHGVAGLLVEAQGALASWPATVLSALKAQAVAQLVWEIRHRHALGGLLAALAGNGIPAVVLKGTAIAYDLYDKPEIRVRTDTDLLVETVRLGDVRRILLAEGFVCGGESAATEQFQLQEVWSRDCEDGSAHIVDLHWQTLNAPALEGVLGMAECMASARKLPGLCEAACALDRPGMLAHAILHRAAHITTPFFHGGFAHYGGDRLIWVQDIHLLANALSAAEWSGFTGLARDKRIARVCLDGLRMAQRLLGTEIPGAVTTALAEAPASEPASAYLLDTSQLRRNWRDFLAIRGVRSKAAYLLLRIIPSSDFMRAKYPSMAGRALAWLYLRRIADLLRKRPGRVRH